MVSKAFEKSTKVMTSGVLRRCAALIIVWITKFASVVLLLLRKPYCVSDRDFVAAIQRWTLFVHRLEWSFSFL